MDPRQQAFNQMYQTREADDLQRAQLQRTEHEGRLLAIDGVYDHWREVLPMLRIGVKDLIDPEAPTGRPERPLQDYHVVALGCPGNQNSPARLEEIRRYLEGGGFVLTTDLCLGLVLRAEPRPWLGGDQVEVGGSSGTQEVDVQVCAPGHPLVKGLPTSFSWHVEGGGHLIRVRDQGSLKVLLRAPALGCNDAVMFVTKVGRGTLVHFLSHAYAQAGDLQGTQAAATILANLFDLALGGEAPAPAPPAPAAPAWFRLVSNATGEAVTIKASGDPQDLRLDRNRVKVLMEDSADEAGNPLYKYFNNDEVPMLEFERSGSGAWAVRSPDASRNTMRMEGVTLDGHWRPVKAGDQLTLFSRSQNREFPELSFLIM